MKSEPADVKSLRIATTIHTAIYSGRRSEYNIY